MSQTPWLIRAEGPGPERRRAERTSRAALDLAAVVEQTGGHLVLHQAVDISFAFEAHHLPRGTVDLRSGDPLGAALADPDAVLVSGAGIYIGTPIARDPRWTQLEAAGRSRVLLVTSGLSGEYFGCQLEGSAAARFLDGVREEHVGIAARLTYPDGTVIEVERTTIGYRSTGSGPAHRSSSLSGLIRQVPEDAIEIESELLDHDELRAAMVEAQRLPRVLPEINGRRWPSWP